MVVNRGSMRGRRSGTLALVRSERPVQGFGETVEDVAARPFQGHALVSQTIQEHPAIGSIKREKVWAAEQIRALRVLLLERLRILPEETRREFFAVQVETGRQEESFGFFLLEDHIAVAIPS